MTIHPDAVVREVKVDDIAVSYYDTGGDRAPIILLHGTGGSTATHFGSVYAMLAARHRVVGVDFAVSDGSDQISVDRLVEQATRVLDEVSHPQGATVVGYSLGAVVATALAARSPRQVDHLVLVAGWAVTDAQQQLRNSIWRTLRQTDSAALQDFSVFTSYGAPYLASRSESEIDVLRSRVRQGPMRDAMMRVNRGVDISADALAVRAKTLIIAGEHDLMVPRHHAEALAGAIADSRLAFVPSGHAIVHERPAQLFSLIDRFVRGSEQTPAGSLVASVAI